jgi:hypothetical protein
MVHLVKELLQVPVNDPASAPGNTSLRLKHTA